MPHPLTTKIHKINGKPHKIIKSSPTANDKCEDDNVGRLHKISEAAYFIALERSFGGGDSVNDWLFAEAIIDGNAFGLAEHNGHSTNRSC